MVLGSISVKKKAPRIFPLVFKSARIGSRIIIQTKMRAGKERTMIPSIKRGDIFYADLSPVVGSEQGGLRPVLIIQNDVGNKYSPTVIAAAITSRMGKTKLPTHIDIHADKVGLSKDSVVLLEQIRTLDKQRLKEKMGHLDGAVMTRINSAIAVSFGLGQTPDEYESAAVASHSSGAVATHVSGAVASTATDRQNGADKGLLG